MGSSASSDRRANQNQQNNRQQNNTVVVHQQQQQQQQQRAVASPAHLNANRQVQRPPQQQAPRPAAVGGVSDVQTVKNLCTIVADSVTFDTANSTMHFVTNASAPCTLEVHAAVRVDVMHGTAMITPNTPKGPPPKVSIGVSEETAHDVFVDVSAMSDAEKKYLLEYPKQLPVVLTLTYECDGQRQLEHTLIALEPACTIVTQLVEAGGSIYKVEHLFGADHVTATVADGDTPAAADEDEDDDNTCVICLTDEKTTAVMPCRHMCLCKACAEQLRVQSPKCPVCRGPIQQLVAMKQ